MQMAAQTEQAGSAILGRPQLGKPLRSAEEDMGHAGQRLRIINNRRSAPQPDDRRERRPDSRNTALPLERFHQRRLLPYFISACTTMPINLEVVAAAENVLAQKSASIGVFDRLLHDLRKITVLPANVDVSGMCARGNSRDHDSFNDRVRIMLENQAVFTSAGLALIAIAQNVFRLRRLLGHE